MTSNSAQPGASASQTVGGESSVVSSFVPREGSMVRLDYDDAVAELVLDAPQKMNAVGAADLEDVVAALARAAEGAVTGDVRALILRGEGRAFCAGRDLNGVDLDNDDPLAYLQDFVEPAMRAISEFSTPTFAVAQGASLGVGLGLLIAADVVYVASNAKFGSPFGKLGCVLDSGGHWLFVERLGTHRALDLMYTGDFISGTEAVTAGLFSRAFETDSLLERSREIAARVAAGPTNAYVQDKQLVNRIRDERLGFWQALDIENKVQATVCAEPNYREGIAAFQEKRAPHFQ